MRVFITKYALTQGIFEVEVDECEGSPGLVADQSRYTSHYRRPDWHLTREEAADRARVMQATKLGALRRQIRKIEAMTFDAPNQETERNES